MNTVLHFQDIKRKKQISLLISSYNQSCNQENKNKKTIAIVGANKGPPT